MSKSIFFSISLTNKCLIISSLLLNKMNEKKFGYLKFIVENQIDKIGMHKSYNLLEHYKFINNLHHPQQLKQKQFLSILDYYLPYHRILKS